MDPSRISTQTSSSGIAAIEGIRLGHATDPRGATGCSVVLCDHDCVGGVDIRGGATATHDVHVLDPTALVQTVQAIVLTGGSAPGLRCIHGVERYLREQGRGFNTKQGAIPIAPGAAIFDLGVGDPSAFPSEEDGYSACATSIPNDEQRGSVGAATGASIGKALGHEHATRGGLGQSHVTVDDGLEVAALAVVNAFGDVVDPDSGRIIGGLRGSNALPARSDDTIISAGTRSIGFGTNTTLVVVATNAKLDKAGACAVSRMAQCGTARAIVPCHTQFDGDLVFTIATGRIETDLNRLGVLSARVVQHAILDGVRSASGTSELPSASDLGWDQL